MGSLQVFDLKSMHERYGVQRVVETGTGHGFGTAYAASFPFFLNILTCETQAELADKARASFAADPRVQVQQKDSLTFLRDTLTVLPDEPIVFWLDAHFPGADYLGASFGAEADMSRRLPLADELALIHRLRPLHRDVILCDDLRIYVDGPFGHGNLPADVRPHCPTARGIEFVEQQYGDTHDISLLWTHEGYIVLTPKEGVS